MSEKYTGYPIDFKLANDPEIKRAFRNFASPEDDSTTGKNARKRAQQFMNDNQSLYVLHSPNSVVRDLYHPWYTEAALHDIEKPPTRKRDEWQERTLQQLREFAAAPDAQEAIADSIGRFYHEIGKRAVSFNVFGDAPYMPIYGDKPTPYKSPLGYFGTSMRTLRGDTARGLYQKPGNVANKMYIPINPIAERVEWTIPSIEDANVRDMIWERLEKNEESVADPRALFALSSIRAHRGLVRADEVFRTK